MKIEIKKFASVPAKPGKYLSFFIENKDRYGFAETYLDLYAFVYPYFKIYVFPLTSIFNLMLVKFLANGVSFFFIKSFFSLLFISYTTILKLLRILFSVDFIRDLLYALLVHLDFEFRNPFKYLHLRLFNYMSISADKKEPHILDVLGDSIMNTYMSYGVKVYDITYFTTLRDTFLSYTPDSDIYINVVLSNKLFYEKVWSILNDRNRPDGEKVTGLGNSRTKALFLDNAFNTFGFVLQRFSITIFCFYLLVLVANLLYFFILCLILPLFLLFYRFTLNPLITILSNASSFISLFFYELLDSLSYFVSIFCKILHFLFILPLFLIKSAFVKVSNEEDTLQIIEDKFMVERDNGVPSFLKPVPFLLAFVVSKCLSFLPTKQALKHFASYFFLDFLWSTQYPLLHPENTSFLYLYEQKHSKKRHFRQLYDKEVEDYVYNHFWVEGQENCFAPDCYENFEIYFTQEEQEDLDDDFEDNFWVAEVNWAISDNWYVMGDLWQSLVAKTIFSFRSLCIFLPPLLTLSVPRNIFVRFFDQSRLLLAELSVKSGYVGIVLSCMKLAFSFLLWIFLMYCFLTSCMFSVAFSLNDMFILLNGLFFCMLLFDSERKFITDYFYNSSYFSRGDKSSFFLDYYAEEAQDHEEDLQDEYYDSLSHVYLVPSFIGLAPADSMAAYSDLIIKDDANVKINNDYDFYYSKFYEKIEASYLVWYDLGAGFIAYIMGFFY